MLKSIPSGLVSDMNRKTKGLIAAPLTPFNKDGSVNLEIIPQYAEMLYKNGIVAVFVNGTTAEGQFLTFEERKAIAKCWVNSAAKDLRVIIHVGYASHEQSQALAVHAASIGADAIGEIGPAILKPDRVETLVNYIKKTASSAPKIPYYYYHMPSMNDIFFPMIEFLQIADSTVPNLAGIKYTHNDIADYEQCLKFKNGKYDILFGRDEFLLDGLKVGALGAVGSTYNIMSSLYYELIREYSGNHLKKARRLQKISADTCRIIYETGDFIFGLKIIMKRIGLNLGNMRRPKLILSDETLMNLELSLEKSGTFNFLNTK